MIPAEKRAFYAQPRTGDQHPLSAALHEGGVFDQSAVEQWEQYERAKQRLAALPLTPSQYEERLALLVDEMGL